MLRVVPSALNITMDTPVLKISSIFVNNKPALLETDPSEVNTLQLNYKQNDLFINFGVLDYQIGKTVRYRYMLEGASNVWVNLYSPSVNFSNLSPGEYILRLNSTGSNGLWGEDERKLRIIITAPFWQTIYFRVLIFLGLISILFYYFYRKNRVSEEEARRQIQFSSELISLQENERRRVSGELHDSIGQNLLVLKNIFDMKTMGNSGVADDGEISELLRESITELRSISSDLYPHQIEQLGVLKASEVMLKKLTKISPVKFTTEFETGENDIPESAKIHIYRIIQEASTNTVKHSHADHCTVSVTKSENLITLIISDNGKGIVKDQESAEVLFYDTTGMGLKNINERTRMIGGELVIRSGAGRGTTITIRFEGKNAN